jgi:hypothetical protein
MKSMHVYRRPPPSERFRMRAVDMDILLCRPGKKADCLRRFHASLSLAMVFPRIDYR